jgi:hypothetical protein
LLSVTKPFTVLAAPALILNEVTTGQSSLRREPLYLAIVKTELQVSVQDELVLLEILIE